MKRIIIILLLAVVLAAPALADWRSNGTSTNPEDTGAFLLLYGGSILPLVSGTGSIGASGKAFDAVWADTVNATLFSGGASVYITNTSGYTYISSAANAVIIGVGTASTSTGWRVNNNIIYPMAVASFSADTIIGYTNQCKMAASQALAIAVVDTYKWWSGDSTYVGTAYINVGVLGTIANSDSVKIINKNKSDSSIIAVPYGTKYLAWTINKVFPKDTMCIEFKKGGTTAGFGDVRVDLNTGTRKGRAW